MTPSQQLELVETLQSLSCDCSNPVAVLELIAVSEFLACTSPNASFICSLASLSLEEYLDAFNFSLSSNDLRLTSPLLNKIPELISHKKYQNFLHSLFPYLFHDWNTLETQLYTSRAGFFTALFILTRESMRISAKDSIFEAFNVFECLAPQLSILRVDSIQQFVDSFCAINTCKIKRHHPLSYKHLRNARKIYKDNKVSVTHLLTHYSEIRKHSDELFSAHNPWADWRQLTKQPLVERGTTVEETLFNNAAFQLRHLQPTDVIYDLFYRNHDDSGIECSILLNDIYRQIPACQNLLIVNPSPVFLNEYHSLVLTGKTTFSVTDSTVKELYSSQFPRSRFITFEEIAGLPNDFDFLLVFARNVPLHEYMSAFTKITYGANVIAFVPQVFITNRSLGFSNLLLNNSIHTEMILSLPNALSNSNSRKKMILYAHKSPVEFAPYFSLLDSEALPLDTDTYLIVNRDIYSIPSSQIEQGYTLAQMRNQYKARINAPAKRKSRAQICHFSKEIKLFYNLYENRHNQYTAKACYRQILSPTDTHTLGKRLSELIEKNLSGKTKEDVLSRIANIVFSADIIPIIIQDVETFYRNTPEVLSLKTVWYCCRPALLAKPNYNDDIARMLFCGPLPHLANLSISELNDATQQDALRSALESSGKINANHWKQLNLFFSVAVSKGYLSQKPSKLFPPYVYNTVTNALGELRQALHKASLSFKEIQRMLTFLLDKTPNNDYPRAVTDSSLLVGAFRLFAGMPIREICALQWKHFHRIGSTESYQIYVMQHVSQQDNIIPLSGYDHKKKYRKIPCPTLLADLLKKRFQYITSKLHIDQEEAMEMFIILSEEPISRSRNTKKHLRCSLASARASSKNLLSKACISSNVISLLDGNNVFEEDLNACKNDIFYANFLHYANNLCKLTEGEACYMVGRKASSTFAEHYADYGNDFLQLDMIQRLNRLWALVYYGHREVIIMPSFSERVWDTQTVVLAEPFPNGLVTVDLSIIPLSDFDDCDLEIIIECDHGTEGIITIYP